MPETLTLEVARRVELTARDVLLTFRSADGASLPGYLSGAHITVTTPVGLRRSYSLVDGGSSAPTEYSICVRRASDASRGSVSMHAKVTPGDLIEVTRPVGAIQLAEARRHILIAGGIGITMIRSLAAEAHRDPRAEVRILYLTRSAADAPFLSELIATPAAEIHHSSATGRFDLWPYLERPDDDTHVYVCGPAGLIEDVLALTAHWRGSRIHVEYFKSVKPTEDRSRPFSAVWQPTGLRVDVPANRSLLSALRRDGISVDSSCESGTCGTCRLAVVAGAVEHRDFVLPADQRAGLIMPCVSRGGGDGEIILAPVAG